MAVLTLYFTEASRWHFIAPRVPCPVAFSFLIFSFQSSPFPSPLQNLFLGMDLKGAHTFNMLSVAGISKL